jgi:hypothetical protein
VLKLQQGDTAVAMRVTATSAHLVLARKDTVFLGDSRGLRTSRSGRGGRRWRRKH